MNDVKKHVETSRSSGHPQFDQKKRDPLNEDVNVV